LARLAASFRLEMAMSALVAHCGIGVFGEWAWRAGKAMKAEGKIFGVGV
jgi:hypothetical protein